MMTENPFFRLAPYIQDWIYAQGWEELRPIQVAACQVIFNSEDNLLLASATASGKTEAAFLPALTLVEEKPSASVGILYISPLKALINDQFRRLDELLKEGNLQVWPWHGDISASRKRKLLKNPSGILQITPESLESLLLNKTAELRGLFGDLRFIILDEVHAFMSSGRGGQLLCLLERLSRIIGYHPRRIGLSATLGDYQIAEAWLSGGMECPTRTPVVDSGDKVIHLALEHFTEPTLFGEKFWDKDLVLGEQLPSHRYIFDHTLGKKCIIFSSTREGVEFVTDGMRRIAQNRNLPDNYLVHHSSIASDMRESAEHLMKMQDEKNIIAATLTLELGIDIGDVERIIHIFPPHAVSTFVQRLGRTGRKTNIAEMIFIIPEEKIQEKTMFPMKIPWYLLQAIAVIQLYLEERWIEPLYPKKLPYNLVYHQTMAILTASGEISPQILAESVLTLTPFENIEVADFRLLLEHLVEIDHIQVMESGNLILGLTGEKIVRNYRFYSTFRAYNLEYTVKHGTSEIGQIGELRMPGERILIGGTVWEVTDVIFEKKILYVSHSPEKSLYIWPGRAPPIHTRIMQKMRETLLTEKKYPYLQPNAVVRLAEARNFARDNDLANKVVFQESKNTFFLIPWVGTKAFTTLYRNMRYRGKDYLGITKLPQIQTEPKPFFLKIWANSPSASTFQSKLKEVCTSRKFEGSLVGEEENFVLDRFDHFLPVKLQQKKFVTDYLDLADLRSYLEKW